MQNFDIKSLVGKSVFIRTVTHYFVGRLVDISEKHFAIDNASWIAETAKWNETVQEGKLNEVYPYYPETVVFVFTTQAVDIFSWPFELPTLRSVVEMN